MLLSYREIAELLERGIVRGSDLDYVNGSSLDVTLADRILTERCELDEAVGAVFNQAIRLGKREALNMASIQIEEYCLMPGEFILAATREEFHLPLNMSAEYKLKSSMARIGLESLNAGWADPGWHASVFTLELTNCTRYTPIVIRTGDRIGQVCFFQHSAVPEDVSYLRRGRYNRDREARGAKP